MKVILLPLQAQSVRSNRDNLEFCQFVTHAEKELLSLFKNIDQDHNGKLSKPELRQAFAGAGVTISQPKLDEFFRNVDLNHDGFISFEEWR